jgi:hypothetical protein
VQPWTTQGGARDMQIAELMQYSDNRIALLYRIPLAVLGIQNTTAHNTEQLMSIWLGMGLGFCLNHIEEAMATCLSCRVSLTNTSSFRPKHCFARRERIALICWCAACKAACFRPTKRVPKKTCPRWSTATSLACKFRCNRCLPDSGRAGRTSSGSADSATAYQGAARRGLSSVVDHGAHP